jgi:hypothetical protein
VQAGQYVEYLYYKRCLHREKMVMLPLELLALTLDLAKHPEQAEQLGEHSAAARVYFPVLAEVVPVIPHLEPESEKIALAKTAQPHFLAARKRGCYSQVAQAD